MKWMNQPFFLLQIEAIKGSLFINEFQHYKGSGFYDSLALVCRIVWRSNAFSVCIQIEMCCKWLHLRLFRTDSRRDNF